MTKPRLKWVSAPPASDWEERLQMEIRAGMFNLRCKEIEHLTRKRKRPQYLAKCRVSERDGWTIYETESWLTPIKQVERFVVLVEVQSNRVVVFEQLRLEER